MSLSFPSQSTSRFALLPGYLIDSTWECFKITIAFTEMLLSVTQRFLLFSVIRRFKRNVLSPIPCSVRSQYLRAELCNICTGTITNCWTSSPSACPSVLPQGGRLTLSSSKSIQQCNAGPEQILPEDVPFMRLYWLSRESCTLKIIFGCKPSTLNFSAGQSQRCHISKCKCCALACDKRSLLRSRSCGTPNTYQMYSNDGSHNQCVEY